MKKMLSLVLAAILLLGCLSVTALAEGNQTTITAVKVAPLSYEIVIPTEVAQITAAGVYTIGAAKVEKVENANAKTVISYTATGTNFKADGMADMPATYYTAYTDETTNTVLTDAPITVYANGAPVADEKLTILSVGISDTDWDAAEAGTYTATVTYDFTAAEAPITKTVSEIIADMKKSMTTWSESTWNNGQDTYRIWANDTSLVVGCDNGSTFDVGRLSISEKLVKEGDQYRYAGSDGEWTFNMADGVLVSVTVAFNSSAEGYSANRDGTYAAPTAG